MTSLKTIMSILVFLSNLVHIKGAESTDVTYEELKELNVTCYPDDTCSTLKPRGLDSLLYYQCNCDMFCARFGSCCVDSPYKSMPTPSTTPTCRRVNAPMSVYGYLIIDKCPESGDSQSVYEDLCRDEWDGENDIMRLVPVTSLFTHITYKNYYCFRCHETNDDFVYWNIRTDYQGQSPVEENAHVQLEFDKHRNSWVAPLGQRGAFIPVSIPEFYIPTGMSSVLKDCWLGVISKCSEYWEDDTVRSKCDAYVSVIIINREGTQYSLYRNPHCAICNFEDLNNFTCRSKLPPTGYGAAKQPFSFTLLLDINQSDGDQVGKIRRCGSNDIWDPFFKKCKTLTCALPGYVVKDGKCTAP